MAGGHLKAPPLALPLRRFFGQTGQPACACQIRSLRIQKRLLHSAPPLTKIARLNTNHRIVWLVFIFLLLVIDRHAPLPEGRGH